MRIHFRHPLTAATAIVCLLTGCEAALNVSSLHDRTADGGDDGGNTGDAASGDAALGDAAHDATVSDGTAGDAPVIDAPVADSTLHDAFDASDARTDALPDAGDGSADGAGGSDAGDAAIADTNPATDSPPLVDSGPLDATLDAGFDACTPLGTGAVGILGCSCSSSGTLACNGNESSVPLICNGTAWAVNLPECAVGSFCDTDPAPTYAGHGLPIAAACANANPGQTVCGDASEVVTCGVDLVTTTPTTACPVNTACAGDGGSAACVCTSGLTGCGSGCVALDTDNNNCGACDNVCSGGTCNNGRCLVTLGSGNVQALAVDGTSVYWTAGHAVMRVPLDGGAAVSIAGTINGGAIAVTPTNLYWLDTGEQTPDSGMVVQATLDGASVTTLASEQGWPSAIAVDSSGVYWTNVGLGILVDGGPWTDVPNAGTLMMVPLDGGAPVTLATDLYYPECLSIDEANAYVCDSQHGKLVSVPKDGGAPAVLYTGAGAAFDAIDSTNIYWTDGYYSVFQAQLDGGARITLSSSEPRSFGIAVDSANVYWTNLEKPDAGGNIVRAPKDGGTLTTVVSGQYQPGRVVVVDDASVYFGTPLGLMKATPK